MADGIAALGGKPREITEWRVAIRIAALHAGAPKLRRWWLPTADAPAVAVGEKAGLE
jgi:hypothetical protein